MFRKKLLPLLLALFLTLPLPACGGGTEDTEVVVFAAA